MVIFIFLIILFYIFFIITSINTTSSSIEDSKMKQLLLQQEIKKYNNLKKYILFNGNIIFLDYSNIKVIQIIVGQNFCFKTNHFDFKNVTAVDMIIDDSNTTGVKVNTNFIEDPEALIKVILEEKKSISQIYIKLTLLSDNNSVREIIF